MAAGNGSSGNALGIDFVTIIAYIVIFLILYYFSRKFIKKVVDTTEARKSEIEEGLKNAQEAEVLKSKAQTEAEAEKKRILNDAYSQADKVVERGKEKEEEIVAEAKTKFDSILKEAETELANIKSGARQEGMKEAREVIAAAVRKAFDGFSISKDEEEKLVAQAIEIAEKSNR
jgi:F-type H+-transporting ATPase subunit b